MDGRKNNGGHKTAGRKPKAEERELIERLSPLDDIAFSKLEEGLREGHKWAIQIFMNYRFGKPRETKDITLNSEQPLFDF